MLLLAEGTTNFPDLTHPQELIQFGTWFWQLGKWLALLWVAVGVVLALQNWSFPQRDRNRIIPELTRYRQISRLVPHALLVLVILSSGFLLSATLANRYHHWEQDKIGKVANTVSGERIEQQVPVVLYKIDEPYTTLTYLNGKPSEVEKIRQVDRSLSPSQSQVEVNITQTTDPASERYLYQSQLTALYRVTNSLDVAKEFTFDAPPPTGYTLLQNYRVVRGGQKLEPQNLGEYQFPVKLAPNESAEFQVSYQAQGASRWVFNTNGGLLSKFSLKILTNFPNAEFASGVIPTTQKTEGGKTQFVWSFDENVSVQNPFGVFTSTQKFKNTGVLPRLLLLAPGILLWWLLLLYGMVLLRLVDVVAASGVYFACLLGLTYLSRLVDPRWAWGVFLWLLLFMAWKLGRDRQSRLGAIWVTLSGAILPTFAFLVPYTGLSLAIAGVLSTAGLITRQYHSPRTTVPPQPSLPAANPETDSFET